MIVGEAATATYTTTKTTMETAPLILITSPTRGELVEAGPVVVRGSAADGLSGLLGVACNGTAATLHDTGFTCQVVVPVGTTSIEVLATDVASNVRTVTVEVTTVDDIGTTPPRGLRVSPATATLVVGASRAFAVRDDLGRIPPGGGVRRRPGSWARTRVGDGRWRCSRHSIKPARSRTCYDSA